MGIRSFVLASLKASGSHLPYRIHFHEFDVDTVGQVLETDKFWYSPKSWTIPFLVSATVSSKRIWKGPWMRML
jgi:hypothetical protein